MIHFPPQQHVTMVNRLDVTCHQCRVCDLEQCETSLDNNCCDIKTDTECGEPQPMEKDSIS